MDRPANCVSDLFAGAHFWRCSMADVSSIRNIDPKRGLLSYTVDPLVEQAVSSVGASQYFSTPFPHIVFNDFFPADFYRKLVGSLPANGYDPIIDTGTRMALRLYGENVEKIDPELRSTWKMVSAVLTSKELEKAIRIKLRDGLVIRARGDRVARPEDLALVARPVIYKDSDGYQIKPHPDTRKKVVTMQLYCPSDGAQKALGTTLYRASLKGLMHPRSHFLEPVKTIPFLPNTGYAFVVLKAYHSLRRMSWHGRPPIKSDKLRVSILNTFYTSENVGF